METVNESRRDLVSSSEINVLTSGIQNINWDNMAFDWNEEKNDWLQEKRMISFQEIVIRVKEGYVIQVGIHPNPERYPNQHVIYVWIRDYVWVVPVVFSKDGEEVFLKTAYPSRRYTKELGRIT
jgi:hypothetical protein